MAAMNMPYQTDIHVRLLHHDSKSADAPQDTVCCVVSCAFCAPTLPATFDIVAKLTTFIAGYPWQDDILTAGHHVAPREVPPRVIT